MSDIEKENKKEVRDFVRVLLKKYWYILLIVVIGVVGAFIGGITVELLFVENGGYGTWTFNDFSVGSSLAFIFVSIGWLLLLVGLPLCGFLGLVGGIFWWKLLSADDKAYIKEKIKKDEDKKEERKARRKKQAKKGGGSGGMTFCTFFIFAIVIFVQGNWLEPFGNLPFSYFILTYFGILIWSGIIFGIGGLVVLILWLSGVIDKKAIVE